MIRHNESMTRYMHVRVPCLAQRRNGVDGYPPWSTDDEARYESFINQEMKALCFAKVKLAPDTVQAAVSADKAAAS